MSITRINEFRAKIEKMEDLRHFLNSIVPLIQSAEGCTSCQLLQNQDDPAKFVIIESWVNVEAHKGAVKKIPSEKLAQLMPLLDGPPTGAYYNA